MGQTVALKILEIRSEIVVVAAPEEVYCLSAEEAAVPEAVVPETVVSVEAVVPEEAATVAEPVEELSKAELPEDPEA